MFRFYKLGWMCLLVTGCGATGSARRNLQLLPRGLAPLDGGALYELWATVADSTFSLGKFNLDASGGLISPAGSALSDNTLSASRDVAAAKALFVSVEPRDDTDSEPSATRMLGGEVDGDSARLFAGSRVALGDDFSSAQGTFVLSTPTDGMGNHERSGLWFVRVSGATVAAGLSLPVLGQGWLYEGWALIGKRWVSAGKFAQADAPDHTAAFSESMAAPQFPGEDFLKGAPSGLSFPTDLSGGSASITLEPVPDDGPEPFSMRPLIGAIPNPSADGREYPLDNRAINFPTIDARLLP